MTKFTKSQLRNLVEELVSEQLNEAAESLSPFLEKPGWEVRDHTEFRRRISDINTSLRRMQELYRGGHVRLEQFSEQPETLEKIKNIFAHPMLETLKELVPLEPEDEYEASLRQAYDKEESAARREGPSTPMTPEEHEEYMSLYDDEEEQEDLPETEIDWHSTLPEKYK